MQDQRSMDEWEEEPIRQLSREEYERLRDGIGKGREAAKAEVASTGSEQQHQSAPGQSTEAIVPFSQGNWDDRTKEVPRPHFYKSAENGKYQLTPRYANEWASKTEEYDSNNE